MTYSPDIRDAVRAWMGGLALANPVAITAAQIPSAWSDESGRTRVQLRTVINAVLNAIPDANRDARKEVAAVITYEFDALGCEPNDAAIATAAETLLDNGLTSLAEAAAVYKEQISALQLPGRARTVAVKYQNDLAAQKSLDEKLEKARKKPARKIDVGVQAAMLQLEWLKDTAYEITQSQLDDFVLKTEKDGVKMPYVVLATDPWTPRGAAWQHQLADKQKNQVVMNGSEITVVADDEFGKDHKQPLTQFFLSLQRYLYAAVLAESVGAGAALTYMATVMDLGAKFGTHTALACDEIFRRRLGGTPGSLPGFARDQTILSDVITTEQQKKAASGGGYGNARADPNLENQQFRGAATKNGDGGGKGGKARSSKNTTNTNSWGSQGWVTNWGGGGSLGHSNNTKGAAQAGGQEEPDAQGNEGGEPPAKKFKKTEKAK